MKPSGSKKATAKKAKSPALLTPEEMQKLAPFECNMSTALRSYYARGIGTYGASVLNAVLEDRGLATVPNAGACVSCSLKLLQIVGKMYFETKEAQASQE